MVTMLKKKFLSIDFDLHLSVIVTTGSDFVRNFPPIVSEALAIRKGLNFAKVMCIGSVDLESDCKEIFRMINNKEVGSSIHGEIVEECLWIMCSFTDARSSRVLQEANREAHLMAQCASEFFQDV